jgi:hypothetical protein
VRGSSEFLSFQLPATSWELEAQSWKLLELLRRRQSERLRPVALRHRARGEFSASDSR